jgi:hypothetical protein
MATASRVFTSRFRAVEMWERIVAVRVNVCEADCLSFH